jgi:hypothetical protein
VSALPDDRITLGFVGDVCLGGEVWESMRRNGPGFPFEAVSPLFKDVDVLVGNLECCLVDESCGIGAMDPMAAPAVSAAALRETGIRVLNLANNHMLDCGPAGLRASRRALDGAQIRHFGAGACVAEAERATTLEYGGRRISFLGACDYSPYYAGATKPGIAPLRPRRLGELVRERRAVDDLVVVSLHADLEFASYPAPWRVRLARWLVDQGASMVVQHHPHTCQGVEEYHGGVIAYSLGNFVFQVHGDGYQEAHAGTTVGMFVRVEARFGVGKPVLSWDCVPVTLGPDHRPHPMDGEGGEEHRRTIRERSRDLMDSRALRDRWRERCRLEGKTTAWQLYYAGRRGQWRKVIRNATRTLVSPEDRRWIRGLLSGGYL